MLCGEQWWDIGPSLILEHMGFEPGREVQKKYGRCAKINDPENSVWREKCAVFRTRNRLGPERAPVSEVLRSPSVRRRRRASAHWHCSQRPLPLSQGGGMSDLDSDSPS
jgi:hypothetical protein